MDSKKFQNLVDGFRQQLEEEHLDYVMVIVNHQELWVFILIMALMFLQTCFSKLLLKESLPPSILLRGY